MNDWKKRYLGCELEVDFPWFQFSVDVTLCFNIFFSAGKTGSRALFARFFLMVNFTYCGSVYQMITWNEILVPANSLNIQNEFGIRIKSRWQPRKVGQHVKVSWLLLATNAPNPARMVIVIIVMQSITTFVMSTILLLISLEYRRIIRL